MPLADGIYDGRWMPSDPPRPTVPVMREPSPSGPRPRDLLIALFAILVNIVVAAALAAWDFIRRTLSRLAP